MNKFLIRACCLLLLSTGLQSCKLFKGKSRKKSKQGLVQVDTTKQLIPTDLAGNPLSQDAEASARLQLEAAATKEIWNQAFDFQYMSSKTKVHYEGGGKDMDFTAHIRMKKDSVIWVSVVLGGLIQVARAVITPDSFKAVLNTERQAYVGPISRIKEVLPEGLDFYSLQNLLLGQRILSAEQVVAFNDSSLLQICFARQQYQEFCTFAKVPADLLQSILLTKKEGQQMSLQQQLFDYETEGDKRFSTRRKINFSKPDNSLNVDMNFLQVEFDQDLSFPFSIPKNYTLK